MTESNSKIVTGIFERANGGGGFLRSPENQYAVRPTDPIVPSGLGKAAGLRGGELLSGPIRGNAGRTRPGRAELERIETIGGRDPADYLELKPFDDLTPIDPTEQVRFETPDGPTTMRVVDLMTPIGLGQRGLIVAPPRTGKTILLKQMAQAVAANRQGTHVIVLLVDERPEEVTDMRRSVPGEVVASSNDKDAESHVRLARLVIEKAKRLVEQGDDVFLLLDSLTRLGRACNARIKGAGRIMSGGLDIKALAEPKGIFGAARNIEHGGSLTIMASALIETGSRMDDVIFNEFKGTGNMEIVLSREMANRRLWPAIDLNPSGTRKEELLLTPEALEVSHHVRRAVADGGPVRAMEQLLAQLERFPGNAEFIAATLNDIGRSTRPSVRR